MFGLVQLRLDHLLPGRDVLADHRRLGFAAGAEAAVDFGNRSEHPGARLRSVKEIREDDDTKSNRTPRKALISQLWTGGDRGDIMAPTGKADPVANGSVKRSGRGCVFRTDLFPPVRPDRPA